MSSAQNFESIFGEDSTRWSYYTDYGGADDMATIFFYCNSDTLIDTENYKILNCTYEMMYSDTFRFGYLREDTVLGKVWFLTSDFQKEMIYMDLALEKGDTFIFDSRSGICSESIVDTTYFENNRKVVVYNDYPNHSFTEGIGSTNGFFNFEEMTCGQYSELLCVFKDGIQTKSSSEGCYRERFDLSIDYFENSNAKVYPNPANGEITIEFQQDMIEHDVSLYSLSGQELFTSKTHLKELIIDLKGYRVGVYLLKIDEYVPQRIIINRHQ